jgi:stress response protein YsnF
MIHPPRCLGRPVLLSAPPLPRTARKHSDQIPAWRLSHSWDDKADQAVDILEDFGPVDIDRRAEEWKRAGWTGYDVHAQPYTAEQIASERQRYATDYIGDEEALRESEALVGAGTDVGREIKAGEEARVPVTEEQVKIGKRAVERGGVRIHTRIKETPVEETLHLRDEQVKVERKPVDRPAEPGDLEAFEEGTIEVTEHAEEPVVSKEARVVEEVVVGKDVKEREQTVREKARRREVEVEEVGAGPGEKHD